MKVSLVIPAHNEQDNIVEMIQKIESALGLEYTLVVVNDHSSDATAGLVRGLAQHYPNIKLVDNLNDKGFANAIKAGFSALDTELAVPVMGDLCDDLATIKKMREKIEEGYDVVCGSRYIKAGARLGGSKLKGFLSCFAGRSLHYLLGVPTSDIANAFKMYRKNVLESVQIHAKGFEISMELPLKAYYQGFKITEVPTVWRERTKGKSSFRIFKLLPNYLKLYIWAILKRITR
jgi:glycosyltransferase involved in cell wall biosynthesis